MSIFVVNSLFFGFSMFLMSILVLLKRWDELARRWFYFSIFVTLWAIPNAFLVDNNSSYASALFASRLSHASVTFIPATWLYFVLGFLNRESRKIFWLIWPVAWVLLLSSPTGLLVPSLSPAKGYVHMTDAGPFFLLQTINFFGIVGYGFFLMVQSYLKKNSRERKKEIFALSLATGIGYTGGGSYFSIVYFRDTGIDLCLLLSLYPFLMAYAMIKHRVLDLEKIAGAFQREKLAAIGTLAASINHEIRNPLYVIKGMAESHLENFKQGIYGDNKKALEHSHEILSKSIEQTQRAMDIMRRFASFAKQRTEEEARFDRVNLNEAFEEIIPLTQHEFTLDKIELVRKIPLGLPSVRADRRHIEEIFFNLLVNACQAMKEKGGKLTIGAEQQNSHVTVLVQDTGPGISTEIRKRLFEPFATSREEGTGLGLYITKQLVERNGGKIRCESSPKGTSFFVEFKV